MKKLLRPGGKLIFMEPNILNPYCFLIFNYLREFARLEPDEMAFSKVFITKMLGKIGFRDIRVTHRDFLLPGVPKFLVTPSIIAGDIFERIPGLRMMSQSIFIVASN
jgi:hypothetical protein